MLTRLTVLALAAGCLAIPAAAQADFRDNTVCRGHIKAGPKDETGLNENPVAYKFGCSQPLTGYAIFTEKEIDAFETEVFVKDAQDAVIPTDAFSCNGDQPGFGINCVGAYNTPWSMVESTFNLSSSKLCDEPRIQPTLFVTYATYAKNADGSAKLDKNGAPTVTTALAGPFNLGRPRGCKPTKFSGKLRQPQDTGRDAAVAAKRSRGR